MKTDFAKILNEIFSLDGLTTFSHFPSLVFILEAIALLWLGKKAFDIFCHYDLEAELVTYDNKAITTGFVGYLAGVAIVLEGVLEGEMLAFSDSLLEIAIWGIISILLLNISGKINDVFILKNIANAEELHEKKNIAVGASVAGSYLGSALIIRSVILGESMGWALDLSLSIFYFILAQIAFYLFSLLYNAVTSYNFLTEIKEGNPAAGVSFGANLVALGLLISQPLQLSFSLGVFLAWFVVGSAAMAFFRFVMDRIIIPSEKLDSEIHQDHNWGIALLEGSFSLTAVLMLQAIFA